MTQPATASGLPRSLLRDVQVLAMLSLSFSILGGVLQETHRIQGVSSEHTIYVQVLSNLIVSICTVGIAIAYRIARDRRGLSAWRAWQAEAPIPVWVTAFGGGMGGGLSLWLLRAVTGAWLVVSSMLWMAMAGLLVHAVTRMTRRIESQSADLSRTIDELKISRLQLMQVDSDARQALAERLHGPIQGELIALEHDLREGGSVAAAERLRIFRIRSIRDVAHQLHPVLLEVGLLPALYELASRSPLPVTINASAAMIGLDDPGEGALSEHLRRGAYTIVQEALLNAVTAGGASRAEVALDIRFGALHVAVSDNGSGVLEPIKRGLGLRAIDAWATGQGGSWSLQPGPHQGSVLSAEIPLRQGLPW